MWTFLGVQGSVGFGLLYLETGHFLQCLPDSELGGQLSSSILSTQPDRSHVLPPVQRAFLCPLIPFPLMCYGRKWAWLTPACPSVPLPSVLLLPTCFLSCSIHVDLWYGKLKEYHLHPCLFRAHQQDHLDIPGYSGTGCLAPWCMALLKASART